MADKVITFKVRGGQITPVLGSCDGIGTPTFIMQSFGVDRVEVDIDQGKTELLTSNDMQGQKPGDIEDLDYIASTYSGASYSGRPLRNTDGEQVFSATETHISSFEEEEVIGL